MRKLSPTFFEPLKSGFLAPLTQAVVEDSDLNLEIRDGYINIYFKGNSLIRLTEISPIRYKRDIHPKFLVGLDIPSALVDSDTTSRFLTAIPNLKQNVIRVRKRSMELEYEQMIIRANNFERRNNSEYFIVDRQYVVPKLGRIDLFGIYRDMTVRRESETGTLCLMEVKFAINDDISDIHTQLRRYYEAIKPRVPNIAEEIEKMFRQKLALGLYKRRADVLDALQTLSVSRKISEMQFVLIFVDYDHSSSKLAIANLRELPFSDQIRVFFSGFAMWHDNVRPLAA